MLFYLYYTEVIMKILFAAFLLTTPMFAVLPPMAQTQREIKAILDSSEFYDYVSILDTFDQIIKTEDGYLIKTTRNQIAYEDEGEFITKIEHQVAVVVQYDERPSDGFVGPAKFTIKFISLACEDI